MVDKHKLPVTMIGGYLGAGKTTLINHLLRHANGLRLAVLVNDFGAMPIDHDLIEAQEDDIITIAGGCICCSYGNDLLAAMMTLAARKPGPDHIILETSGVAIPGAITTSLALLRDVQQDAALVLADGETIEEQAADRYVGDLILQQLRDADIIVVNKVDLLDARSLQARLSWLEKVNPNAACIAAERGRLPSSVVLQAATRHKRDRQSVAIDDNRFSSFVLNFPNGVDLNTLAESLASPSLALIRAKGFVADKAGKMQQLQSVGRRVEITDAPAVVEAGIVCIGMAQTVSVAKTKLRTIFPNAVIRN